MSFGRKLKRGSNAQYNKDVIDLATEATKRSLTKVREQAYIDASNDAIARVTAVACEVIYNDYGKLNKKDTRLKKFVTLLYSKLKNIECPSDEQLEVERLLYKECGISIKR